MPRILLLSSSKFLVANSQVFEKPFREMRIAHVITASKSVPRLAYLERERTFFDQEKYNRVEYDLDGKTEDQLLEDLSKFEIIYLTGGNTFYLLKSIRESGFDKIVGKLLNQGIIYMGASAGSYVACPTIEMSLWKHQDKYNHHGVTDFTGLNLVPFLVSAHYKLENDEVIKAGVAKTKLPVKILNDDQAILVEDRETTLLGDQDEIKLI